LPAACVGQRMKRMVFLVGKRKAAGSGGTGRWGRFAAEKVASKRQGEIEQKCLGMEGEGVRITAHGNTAFGNNAG